MAIRKKRISAVGSSSVLPSHRGHLTNSVRSIVALFRAAFENTKSIQESTSHLCRLHLLVEFSANSKHKFSKKAISFLCFSHKYATFFQKKTQKPGCLSKRQRSTKLNGSFSSYHYMITLFSFIKDRESTDTPDGRRKTLAAAFFHFFHFVTGDPLDPSSELNRRKYLTTKPLECITKRPTKKSLNSDYALKLRIPCKPLKV